MADTVQLLENGIELHLSGQLEQAGKIYKECLASAPLDARALHLLGVLSFDMGNFEESLDWLIQAVGLEPGAAEFQFSLAQSQQKLLLENDAVSSYKKALLLNPDFIEAHMALAGLYTKMGRVDEAIDNYTQILNINMGQTDALMALGNLLRENSNPEEAIVCYETLLKFDPTAVQAYVNLGMSHQTLGNLDQAFAHYNQALALNPNLTPVYGNIAVMAFSSQQYAIAIQCFEKVIELDSLNQDAYRGIAACHIKLDQFEQAVHYYKLLFNMEMSDETRLAHLRNIETLYLVNRQYNEIVAFYQEILQTYPDNAVMHFNLGNFQYKAGQVDQAIRSYLKSFRLDPPLSAGKQSLVNGLLYVCLSFYPAVRFIKTKLLKPWETVVQQKS